MGFMEQPKWFEYMLPELKLMGDGQLRHRNEIIEKVANIMGLTEELKSEMISPIEARYTNRAGWALTYLKQSGLIESPKRAHFQITKIGLDYLSKNPKTLLESDLKQFKGYQEFMARNKVSNKQKKEEKEVQDYNNLPPLEQLKNSYELYRQSVCDDLAELLRNCDDRFFERICVQLISAMGYGEGEVTQRSHDGGIDGVINQDKLGLDKIYIQAKRYKDHKVSGTEIRQFIGDVVNHGAKKGIFMTSDSFVSGAESKITTMDVSIILVDGQQMARYMYDYDVGVSEEDTFKIKKIDSDYFE